MEWIESASAKQPNSRPLFSFASALVGCGLYAAFFGSLSSAAFLSSFGLLWLLPGAAVLIALCVLPDTRPVRLLALGVALSALGFLLLHPLSRNGIKLLVNRLFAASEAVQSYRYDYFSLASTDLSTLRLALLPAGCLAGVYWGVCIVRQPKAACLPFLGLLLAFAYLGITPGELWLPAAGVFLFAAFLHSRSFLPVCLRLLAFLSALLLGIAVMAVFPGKHEALKQWEQSARDRLALQTVAYGAQSDAQTQEEDPPEETRPFEELDPEPEEDGPTAWDRYSGILLTVILILLLLFLPAVWTDRLRKKRSVNRRGLTDSDKRIQTVSEFLYAVRWLNEAGLDPGNLPFSSYTSLLAGLDKSLAASCEAVIPLWQAAAYSNHPIAPEDAARMKAFRKDVQRFARSRMSKPKQWIAAYVHAL